MEGSLVDQGLTLMLFGMGVVFAFLSLLVATTIGMSALARRLAPPTQVSSDVNGVESDTPIVAVITAAIHQHRQKHK